MDLEITHLVIWRTESTEQICYLLRCAKFADDDLVKGIFKRECAYLDEWISEHSEEEQQDRPKRTLGSVETAEEFDDARSIFDDVDA